MTKALMILISVLFLFSAPAFANWSGDVSVGANLQSGNTDKASVSLGASASQKVDKDRFAGSILYNYAEEDNTVTVRNIYSKGQYDGFVNNQLYVYLSVELQKDTFKNLNLRTIVGPGVGLQLFENDLESLSVEGGVAYFSEDLDTGVDTQWLTARVGAKYLARLSDTIKYAFSVIINPSIEDVGEYTARSEVAITSAISENWSVKLENIVQHNSQPAAGVEKRDMTWIAGLMYNF